MFDFLFGTDEFPEGRLSDSSDTFAAFLDDIPITFDAGRNPVNAASNFITIQNAVAPQPGLRSSYDIEYDGLTNRLRTRASLDDNVTTHALKFVIGDAGTDAVDSGVFLTRLQGGTTTRPGTTTVNPGYIVLQQAPYRVNENAGSILLTVDRLGDVSGVASDDFTTADGAAAGAPSADPDYTPAPATAGADYAATTGTLLFQDGETSKIITIPILDDLIPEGDEDFSVAFANASEVVIGTEAETVTIVENELCANISRSSYSVREDAGFATVTATRFGDLSIPGRVTYATADGTAAAPQDYEATSGALDFAPGERTKQFQVKIVDNFFDEPSQSFNVTLTGAGAPLVVGERGTAAVEIQNFDRPATPYDVEGVLSGGRVAALKLSFNKPLNAADAIDPANYGLYQRRERRFGGSPSRNRVGIKSVVYDPATSTVLLYPNRFLQENVFYESRLRQAGPTAAGLRGATGEAIDGDADGIPGTEGLLYWGRGKRLVFNDRDGDRVQLGTGGGGVMEVLRDPRRDVRVLRALSATPASSYLYGFVRKYRHGDGTTAIDTLQLNGINSYLGQPPFIVGPGLFDRTRSA
jgi:hypothetical protein